MWHGMTSSKHTSTVEQWTEIITACQHLCIKAQFSMTETSVMVQNSTVTEATHSLSSTNMAPVLVKSNDIQNWETKHAIAFTLPCYKSHFNNLSEVFSNGPRIIVPILHHCFSNQFLDQPAMREVCSQLDLGLLTVFCLCIYFCVHTYLTCSDSTVYVHPHEWQSLHTSVITWIYMECMTLPC